MRRPSNKDEVPSNRIRCAREYSVLKTACLAPRGRYSFEFCPSCGRKPGSSTDFAAQRSFSERLRELPAHRVTERDHSGRRERRTPPSRCARSSRIIAGASVLGLRARAQRSSKRLPGYRLGKYWRFRKDEVLAWVDCHRGGSQPLDMRATLKTDAEQAGRAIEVPERGGTMARRGFQQGTLFQRGTRRKLWVARWWEDVIQVDGALGRLRRSEVIGTVAEFPTRRKAMQVLSQKLRAINRGDARPQSVRTFGDFVKNDWMPVILPTLKFATQKHYRYMLDVHLIPAFGKSPLRLRK